LEKTGGLSRPAVLGVALHAHGSPTSDDILAAPACPSALDIDGEQGLGRVIHVELASSTESQIACRAASTGSVGDGARLRGRCSPAPQGAVGVPSCRPASSMATSPG
jgi:hypothetical protein